MRMTLREMMRTAGMLSGAQRAAMMLLATLLLTMTAQTAWASTSYNVLVSFSYNGSTGWYNDFDASIDTSVSYTINPNGTIQTENMDGDLELKITPPTGYAILSVTYRYTDGYETLHYGEMTLSGDKWKLTFPNGTSANAPTVNVQVNLMYSFFKGELIDGKLTIGDPGEYAAYNDILRPVKEIIIMANVTLIVTNNLVVEKIDVNSGSQLTLGYSSASSSIMANSYSGGVKIANNQKFMTNDETPVEVSGIVSDNSTINDKKLTPKAYTVTFDSNDGSDVEPQTVAHSLTATVPDPSRFGYVLQSWKNGNAVYDFSTPVTTDLELTAVWTPKNIGYCGQDNPETTDVDESENVTWNYDADTKTLTISPNPEATTATDFTMADYVWVNANNAPEARPWSDYSANITSVVIDDGVQSVGDYCFYGLTALIDVSLGSSVESIGYGAFDGCTSLTNGISFNAVSVTLDNETTMYSSFGDAFNAAKAATDNNTELVPTIKLLKNVYVGEHGYEISYNLTLDLNGHDFSSMNNFSAISVGSGGVLTLIDSGTDNNKGSVQNNNSSCSDAIHVYPGGTLNANGVSVACPNDAIWNCGTATIENCNLSGGYGISSNHSVNGTTTTITTIIRNSIFSNCNYNCNYGIYVGNHSVVSIGSGVSISNCNYAGIFYGGGSLTLNALPTFGSDEDNKNDADIWIDKDDNSIITFVSGSYTAPTTPITIKLADSLNDKASADDLPKVFTTGYSDYVKVGNDVIDPSDVFAYYDPDLSFSIGLDNSGEATIVDPRAFSYIDENGVTQSKVATVLTGNETELGVSGSKTWYVCNSTLSYDHRLKLLGDVHLILADGCKMTAGEPNFGASVLYADNGQLTINGQTNGTGVLDVITEVLAISVPDDALTICGGVVKVEANTAFNGESLIIYGGKFTTVGATNSISISATNVQIYGGKVDVSGSIQSTGGDIILGWTNVSDYIKAASYHPDQDHNVKIADGKVLKYTADNTVTLLHPGPIGKTSGTYKIDGKTLTPGGIFGYCGDKYYSGGKNVYWSIALKDNPQNDDIFSNELVIEKNTNTVNQTNFDMANYDNYNASEPGNFAPWIKPNTAGNKSDGLKYPITTVTIADGVTSVGQKAFDNCSGLQNVTIGNSVTTIGENAFFNCSGLQNVTIGNDVTTIGEGAFQNCRGLQEVSIGSSVTTIGYRAFDSCIKLQNVTIPASVTIIGDNAFSECRNLTVVTMSPITPPRLDGDIFVHCLLKLILVPNETAYDDYNDAGGGWNGKYSDDINTEPEDITYKSLLAPSEISLAKNTSGWGTYCHRYPVSYSLSEGATAYTISGLNDAKTAVTTTATTGNIVAPFTPLLLNYTAPDNNTETDDENVTLTALPATATTDSYGAIVSNGGTGWNYYGNTTGTTLTHTAENDGIPALTGGWPTYILHNGTFALVDTDEGIPAHRCVLSVGSSAARVLCIGIGDETTAVESEKVKVNSEKSAAATVWYDLQGRKLDKQPTKKGLYINNGKKTVIK